MYMHGLLRQFLHTGQQLQNCSTNTAAIVGGVLGGLVALSIMIIIIIIIIALSVVLGVSDHISLALGTCVRVTVV
jgi:hypothetical protein